MKNKNELKLGIILHIVEKEAITQPSKAFKAKGARVYLKNVDGSTKTIGILGDPFGNVDQPYQPIILKNVDPSLVGKFAFAEKKRRKRKYKKKYSK